MPRSSPEPSSRSGSCHPPPLCTLSSSQATTDKTHAISAITERMRPCVENREISGAVTLVATPDRIVHLDAIGKADISADKPMRPDSIFWIASMTKPITATAVMMLQDEGRLSVEDPVEKHLPEFKDLKTADGKPARVTIRHLLTHTSGMGEASPAEARGKTNLAGLIPVYIAKPVKFEPGTKWTYCQSGINTAARIVEVASGVPFDQFVERRLFGPLGMKDTTFYLTDEQLPRLATSYRRNKQGELEATDVRMFGGKSPTSRDRYPAANGGLFSTATDYAKFCQMIANGGEARGAAVPEAGVRQADDLGTNRRIEDRLHRRQWLGPGLVCCAAAAGDHCRVLPRHVRPWWGLRHSGVDRPRQGPDLYPDDPARGFSELRRQRGQASVSGGGELRLERRGVRSRVRSVRLQGGSAAVLPARQFHRATQNRFGSPWKLMLNVFEPSATPTLPVPMECANAPAPLLTTKA